MHYIIINVENSRPFFFQYSLMNRNLKRSVFILNIFLYIINAVTATYDQFNASLQNKCINFFKKIQLKHPTDPKLLNGSV